ncbi:hypothetical protein HELRODRAFT_160429 [Helobdella robusta]|uniref:Uncharacterized protein n=1 Tax=Helobdella robusta TaxID=6412 RepID=T1EQ85_HELRO|nr:hypothetical protein HELRODRAFT_160429 [Helobdella robusta]ESO06269.1 hypothetical protein HELRODRAFT_160429 [Helobdella robusta]
MTNFIIQLRKNVREIALSSFVMALFYLTFQKWYDFTLLFPFSKFQLHVQPLSSVHSSSLDRTDAIHFGDDPHSSDIFFELDVQEKYLLRNIVTAGASKHGGFNSSNLPASNKKLVEEYANTKNKYIGYRVTSLSVPCLMSSANNAWHLIFGLRNSYYKSFFI